MSSNDMLVILKKKGLFEIHHDLCVDNEFKSNKSTLLSKKSDLIEAIKFAKDYCNEEMVEYGYSIHDNCLTKKGGKHGKTKKL